jgi:hypothetical protein
MSTNEVPRFLLSMAPSKEMKIGNITAPVLERFIVHTQHPRFIASLERIPGSDDEIDLTVIAYIDKEYAQQDIDEALDAAVEFYTGLQWIRHFKDSYIIGSGQS